MISHVTHTSGLPTFVDCIRSSNSTLPNFLHCVRCGGIRFYRLEQTIEHYGLFEAVYICMACCGFHTVNKVLKFVEDGDDIEQVLDDTWKLVDLIETD